VLPVHPPEDVSIAAAAAAAAEISESAV
jgi:hypothetical protein